jgi:hypothetical protein
MEVVSVDSGSSESVDKAVNVNLDYDKIFRLGEKIVGLLYRKSKGRSSRLDILNEYWALRLVALYYDFALGCPVFDNEPEIVAFFKRVIARESISFGCDR